MNQQEAPKQMTLTLVEAESLKERVSAGAVLSEKDITILTGLISFNIWLQKQLSLARLSIHRLKKLFGFSTEKKNGTNR